MDRQFVSRGRSSMAWGLALGAALLAGCASQGRWAQPVDTGVDLRRGNYTMVKPNVKGTSTGFRLLGFIPFVEPQFSKAKRGLYRRVDEPLTGRSIALINQTEDHSTIYLILFSLPRLTLTADVIEFSREPDPPASAQERTPLPAPLR